MNFFQLFFPDTILETIVKNTNAYASSKGADTNVGRLWEPLTLQEFLRFIAYLIYRGLFPSARLADYTTDSRKPRHIDFGLTLKRVEQIKRYLHISAPPIDPEPSTQAPQPAPAYYEKVQPLLAHVQSVSKAHYVPRTNVAVDEMIVRFGGRSQHTFRIKSKPVPVGYKILALCDAGYTYAFIPESRVQKNHETKDQVLTEAESKTLSDTARKVIYLVEQLPLSLQTYNVYSDNYFSSIPLFQYLRAKNIGACGTARPNSSKFPAELRAKRKLLTMDWDEKHAVIVDGVLAALWMDNGPVTMLTTIHGIIKEEGWTVDVERRRPRLTSTNGRKVNVMFGKAHRKVVPIPRFIDDYNKYMGSVDIADQLRSYYTVQMRSLRNWLPLFLWLLDTAIINSYILRCLHLNKQHKSSHREFRLDLLHQLLQKATPILLTPTSPEQETTKRQRTTYASKHQHHLGSTRFDWALGHFPVKGARITCAWCKNRPDGKVEKEKMKSEVHCNVCKVSLCFNNNRNCFLLYHTKH